MAKRKPSLAAAVHSAAREAPALNETVALVTEEGEPKGPRPRRQQRQREMGTKATSETCGVLIQVPVATWRTLRHLAVDEDTSVKALGHEALRNLLSQRGWLQ